MSKSTLFDINPDQLFEQKSVQEIDQVRLKLQHEIEKKREELRTMVGERYRDLIQAADTITEMKNTSANVIKHIGKISAACDKSQETCFLKQQIVSKKMRKTHTTFSKNSIAAQINILLGAPERIWTCLENEDYLGAMELYLFAQNIMTGLQFRMNDDVQFNWLGLVDRQWKMISTFKDMIKNACYEALKTTDIKAETAVQCICSLSLPDEAPLSDILNKFITLRVEALDDILHPKDEQYNVKTKVMESACLLINTLVLIYECFIDKPKSLIGEEFEKISNIDMLPVIQVICLENPVVDRLLGDDILNFKPSLNMNNSISTDQLNKAMKLWLTEVEVRVNKDLADLINLVNSVKSLQGIRHNLSSTKKPSHWQEICEKLSINDMNDIFVRYYQPLLTKRIQHLINLTWSKAIACIKTDIEKILANNLKNGNKNQKDNISWKYIEDLADGSKKKFENETCDNTYTLINVYGFDSDMIKSCKMFNKCLRILLEDVHYYLFDGKEVRKSCDDMDEDSRVILKYLNDSTSRNVKSLIDHITKEYLNQDSCLVLSRYINAVMHLCPNLSKCFNKDLEEQIDVLDELVALDMKFWKVWLDSIDNFIRDVIDKQMPKELNARVMLNVLSQWEKVTIQEKDDESNETIDSNIRIPVHSSFPLQNVLCQVNSRIAQVRPHLMPDTVRKELIKDLTHNILDQYEVYVKAENSYVKTNQVAALQFYFDARYLQTLTSMNVRDEQSGYQKVIDNLKGTIDPFDFDVFYPHFQRNVKRAVQKTQVQFGCLVGNQEQLNALLANTPLAANSNKHEIACIIPLVTSQNDNSPSASYWFTLLPITSIGNRTVEKPFQPQMTVKKTIASSSGSSTPAPTTTTVKQSQQKASAVRSSAAAFFGSMGQDWFGTY